MLQSFTRSCIDKLTKIGLSVKVLICGKGSKNHQFIESLEKVTCDKPFITVDHKNISVIYDPTHLLKNVCNFKKHGFFVNNQSIKWQYVTQFYGFDKANTIRMASKLQDKHIDLSPFSAMRVNLAVQVWSHSAAAGISTVSILGNLDAQAKHTASFIALQPEIPPCHSEREWSCAIFERCPYIPT